MTTGLSRIPQDFPKTFRDSFLPQPQNHEKRLRQVCFVSGVQLSKVTEKLNGVTDGGRRKLNVVTDGATGKSHTFTHTERVSVATLNLSDRTNQISRAYATHTHAGT